MSTIGAIRAAHASNLAAMSSVATAASVASSATAISPMYCASSTTLSPKSATSSSVAMPATTSRASPMSATPSATATAKAPACSQEVMASRHFRTSMSCTAIWPMYSASNVALLPKPAMVSRLPTATTASTASLISPTPSAMALANAPACSQLVMASRHFRTSMSCTAIWPMYCARRVILAPNCEMACKLPTACTASTASPRMATPSATAAANSPACCQLSMASRQARTRISSSAALPM